MDQPQSEAKQQIDSQQVLQAVSERMAVVSQRLDTLERAQGIKHEEGKGQESSRALIAGGLALIAAKTLFFLGAKVGAGRGAYAIKKATGQWPKNFMEAMQDERLWKPALIDGSISAAVGAVVGGLFGWKRGERIHDAHEILTSPIQTVKTLVQSEEAYQKDQEARKEVSDTAKQTKRELDAMMKCITPATQVTGADVQPLAEPQRQLG